MDYCNHKLSTKHFEDKTSLILCEYCKRTEDEIALQAKVEEMEEAFLQEQQACVDALSKLDDAQDDLAKCMEEFDREIDFALEIDDYGLLFLQLWREGFWDEIDRGCLGFKAKQGADDE